jgi:tetratricopeptide (TPR) repeat protein
VSYDPDEIVAQAHNALQTGRWDRAETLLLRLARSRLPTAHDLILQAELEVGRGRIDRAVRLLTEIPASDPLAARARLQAGQLEKVQHRARSMEVLFQEALRLDPKMAPVRRGLIYVYAMQGRRRDLNKQYRALAELEPLTYDDVFLWTVSLDDVWLNEGIRDTLERFLEADSHDLSSRLALAGVLLKVGDLDGAEKTLEPLSNARAAVLAVRARIALRRSQFDRLRDVLAGAPRDHAEIAVLRGELALQARKLADAEDEFRRTLRLDDTNREALQGLIHVLTQQGRRDEAAVSLKRADLWRKLKEQLEDARGGRVRQHRSRLVSIAETCAALDRQAEAAAWYGLALQLDPLDRDVQEALYRLRKHVDGGSPQRSAPVSVP